MHKVTRKLATALGALVLSATAAFAQPVTYSTSLVFNDGAGCNGLTCTRGGYTISFVGLTNEVVTAPSNIQYGYFQASGSGATGDFSNLPFILTLTQSVPSAGSTTFNGNFLANTTITSTTTATGGFNFSETMKMIGSSTYMIIPAQQLIVPPAVGQLGQEGRTTVNGTVSVASTVPEPSTYALMGTGLLGLAGLARRRRNNS